MTKKFNLLAGAGLGIAMLAAGATPAVAKATKHTTKRAVRHTVAEHHDSEIEALRRQVEALTARLNAQEQNQQQTVAKLDETQNQAAAAQATAAQAQTQVAAVQTSLPKEVKTQIDTEYPKKRFAWAGDTSISGRMYFNFSNISANGGGHSNGGTGFNIKRMYVGVDHTFSKMFSANVTMDVSNVVGSTSNYNYSAPSSTSGLGLVGRGFFIKKAYLQANLNPALIIRVGSADLPWIPYEENINGFRHIENTNVERAGFGTSADWGVHILGDLAGGILSYQVSVIDGAGYRNVKVTNSVDVEGRLSASYKGFYAAGGFYSGKRGNDTSGTTEALDAHTHHTATRYNALVGFKNKLFNIGGSYFYAKNWNSVMSTTQDKAVGWNVFGNVNFRPRWSIFGRYDWVKPNELGTAAALNSRTRDHYYNVGLQWEPAKIVDLAIVYKRDNVDNGAYSTTNGTIGTVPSSALLSSHGTYREIGLFGQFRF